MDAVVHLAGMVHRCLNLVSAIQAYLATSNPPTGHAWLVADDDVVSTETPVRAMAAAMNVPARVVRLPDWLLAATARMGDGCKRIGLPAPWTSEVRGTPSFVRHKRQ